MSLLGVDTVKSSLRFSRSSPPNWGASCSSSRLTARQMRRRPCSLWYRNASGPVPIFFRHGVLCQKLCYQDLLVHRSRTMHDYHLQPFYRVSRPYSMWRWQTRRAPSSTSETEATSHSENSSRRIGRPRKSWRLSRPMHLGRWTRPSTNFDVFSRLLRLRTSCDSTVLICD